MDRLSVFAFKWAIATLFHQFVYLSWITNRSPLGVLLQPRSIGLFLVMLALSIGYWFQKMPFLSNHLLLQIMIDLFVLLSMGWAAAGVPQGNSRASFGGRRAPGRVV